MTLTAVAVSVLGARPVQAQIDGLEVDATTTYRVVPAAESVRVRVEARLVNTMPSRRRGAYIETPYFDRFAVPAQGPVDHVRARSSVGGQLSTDVETADDGFSVILVDLAPNLVHGAPQSVVVEFDLPGQPARSRFPTRVNAAFASWLIAGTGDAGDIDIVIDMPSSFELLLTKGVEPTTSLRKGRRVVRLDDVERVSDAVMFVSASDDKRLASERLRVGATDVTLRAWPNDRRWRKFAIRTVRRGLPVLAELTGVDVPRRDLTVLESARSYQLGYAGSYDPLTGVVEVGDRLDQAVILHELGHVWFNDDLFTGRWISEGLAEEFANRAMEQLGKDATPPRPIDRKAPGAIALNEWPMGPALDAKQATTERFAYGASYAVVHQLSEELGEEGLRRVVTSAKQRHIPYQGDEEPEQIRSFRDWRYFYDLVDLVGGADPEPVFVAHVLTGKEAAMLHARSRARRELERLAGAGQGWSAPFAVRKEMAYWRFASVKGLVDEAHSQLTRARRVAAQLDGLDIDASTRLEREYESAERLDALDRTLDDFEEVTAELVAVRERWDTANPVVRLGLAGAGSGFTEAAAAISDDDLDQAHAAVARLSDTVDRAGVRGALILLALVLLVAVGTAHVRIRRE